MTIWSRLSALFLGAFGRRDRTTDTPTTDAPATAHPRVPTAATQDSASTPAAIAHLPASAPSGPWVDATPSPSDPDEARTALLDRLYAAHDATPHEGDRAFLQRVIRECSSRRLDFPLFPDVALQLDGMLRCGEPPVDDVVRLVKREPDLVRRVWQQASGAAFARKAETLEEAVMRLGYQTIWRIGMGACMNAPVFRVRGFQDEANHVRALGVVAADVAMHAHPTGDAYLAGLLHGVGKLLVYRAAVVRPGQAAPDAELVHRVAREHHPAIGVLIADAWKMSPAVTDAVGTWPDATGMERAERGVARAVRAACIAAHAAAAARAGRDEGGLLALLDIPGPPLDAARLIARAHAALDGVEPPSETEPADAAAQP
jgi:HD-like signal output (HDOD) protein